MKHRYRIALTALIVVIVVVSGRYTQAQPSLRPPAILLPDAMPVRSCESLASIELPDTIIRSAAVEDGVCRITAVKTHPPAGDAVTIWVGIPLSGWNGRFMGTGGGGFSGGSPRGLEQPLSQGYAAAATDTGHEGGSGSFALDMQSGALDWQSIRDNAHVGIHEMTVTGKALTEALYGTVPAYSYFNGCSTGGRQGLMEAQRYPSDYDGILAGAPAINWPKLHVQQLWGPLLMNVEGNPIAPCKLAAATAAAIEACDSIDRVVDGVIEDPARCAFDPATLVGETAGDCGAFTAADASIVRGIWEGPRRADGEFLWHGAAIGSDLAALSGSRSTPLQPQAMSITLDWFKYFLTQNPNFDWTEITQAGYERLWEQSVEQYGLVIGTDDADLSAFRDLGGKAIVWHGWADQLITAFGSVDYFDRVFEQMGGVTSTGEFIRLFMAPGVAHCAGGYGPNPTGQLDALVSWVEQGVAPDSLTAVLRDGETLTTRPLCPYPQVARYRGTGSTDSADNFECAAEF